MMSFWLDVFIGVVRTDMMQRTLLIVVPVVFLPIWCLNRDIWNYDLWLAYIVFTVA